MHTNVKASTGRRFFLGSAMPLVWAVAFIKLVLHTYFNSRYGYFRDEFNYLSSGVDPEIRRVPQRTGRATDGPSRAITSDNHSLSLPIQLRANADRHWSSQHPCN
jgi:hypothetical protein